LRLALRGSRVGRLLCARHRHIPWFEDTEHSHDSDSEELFSGVRDEEEGPYRPVVDDLLFSYGQAYGGDQCVLVAVRSALELLVSQNRVKVQVPWQQDSVVEAYQQLATLHLCVRVFACWLFVCLFAVVVWFAMSVSCCVFDGVVVSWCAMVVPLRGAQATLGQRHMGEAPRRSCEQSTVSCFMDTDTRSVVQQGAAGPQESRAALAT